MGKFPRSAAKEVVARDDMSTNGKKLFICKNWFDLLSAGKFNLGRAGKWSIPEMNLQNEEALHEG